MSKCAAAVPAPQLCSSLLCQITGAWPAGEEWVELQDGRSLCLLCLSLASATVDTADAQPLYDALLAFYSQLGMPLPVRPPMILVDLNALNSAGEARRHTLLP
jgi:hypothetical protein